jgi:DNA-binding LytR/AlgR family response regulator
MEPNADIIWVQTSLCCKKVEVRKILYCQAEDGRTTIYSYPKGKIEGVCESLSELDKVLPHPKFCLCNRQVIVNTDFIDEYWKKISELVLVNKKKITLSRRRRKFIDDLISPV